MNLLKDANKYFSDQYSKYVDLCVIQIYFENVFYEQKYELCVIMFFN